MNPEKTSMTELEGTDVYSDWDSLMSAPSSSAPKSSEADLTLDNLIGGNGDTEWLSIFQKTNLPGMDLVALNLFPGYVYDFGRDQHLMNTQVRNFLLMLPIEHLNELRVAGLSEDQIANISGGILPINWTVHLKYPLAYGGTIEKDNLVLIPHHPFHEELHHFVNQQIVTDAGVISPHVLYMPVPKGTVYVPFAETNMASEVKHIQLAEEK